MKKSQIRQRLVMKMLDTSHIEQFNELLRYAFQVTDSDLLFTGWSDDSIKRSKYPILQHAKVLGWFDKGQDSRKSHNLDSKESRHTERSESEVSITESANSRNLDSINQTNLDFTESIFYQTNEFANLDSKKVTESANDKKDASTFASLKSQHDELHLRNLDSINKENNILESSDKPSRHTEFSRSESEVSITESKNAQNLDSINQANLDSKDFIKLQNLQMQNIDTSTFASLKSQHDELHLHNIDSIESANDKKDASTFASLKSQHDEHSLRNLDSNDKLVSQIALYPMKMNIYNQIYAMGGITGVATYPEYSGIGLMADLMKEILKIMRDSRQSIACLYPYSIPYYRSRGFEIVSDKMTFSIKDNQFPKPPAVNGMMQRVCENHPDLIALHNEFASKTHGCLVRDSLAWNEYWRWDVEDTIVAIYYDESDKPTGYIVYLLENDIFKIKEMIYLNEEARHGLWGYIEAHKSMFERIEGANYSNHSLAFLLEDGHIKESISPYIMARIVDVTQFLERYPFDSVESSFTLCLVVSDPLLEWNNMAFVLHFSAQGFKVEMVERGFVESLEFMESKKADSIKSNSLRYDTESFSDAKPPRHAEPQAKHLNFDKSQNVDSIDSINQASLDSKITQNLDSIESNSLHYDAKPPFNDLPCESKPTCDAKSFGSTHSPHNAKSFSDANSPRHAERSEASLISNISITPTFAGDSISDTPPFAGGLGGGKSSADSIKSAEIIKLDIQTLSAMLLGYKRPLYLRSIGRLEASDNAINKLEEILPEGKAYFSDYF